MMVSKGAILSLSAIGLVTQVISINAEIQSNLAEERLVAKQQIEKIEQEKKIAQQKLEEEIRLTEEAKDKILEEEAMKAEARIKEMERMASVCFLPSDIRVISNLTTVELRQVFSEIDSAKEMVRLAPAFIDAERVYGVNALALAGIVAVESSWNTSSRAIRQNNLTGYAVYSDSSKGKDFLSEYDCILETARLLKQDYLTDTGQWHNGYSIESVNIMYSSDKQWNNKVAKIGKRFLNKYLEITNQI